MQVNQASKPGVELLAHKHMLRSTRPSLTKKPSFYKESQTLTEKKKTTKNLISGMVPELASNVCATPFLKPYGC